MTLMINGINYAWKNLTFILFGVPVAGITKINYKKKQTKENSYGYGDEPVSRSYGNKEYEGSIEIFTDEWLRIIAASPNNEPLDIKPFEIQVMFSGDGVLTKKDVLQYVEFLENPLDANQGDPKLLVTVPLVIGGIKRGQ